MNMYRCLQSLKTLSHRKVGRCLQSYKGFYWPSITSNNNGNILRYCSSKTTGKSNNCKDTCKDPCGDTCKSEPSKTVVCTPDPPKFIPPRPDPVVYDPCNPVPCPTKPQVIEPCRPKPKRGIPHMDDMPKPCGSWKERQKILDRKNNNTLLIGILSLLATLIAVWKLGFFNYTAEERTPRKKQIKKPKEITKIPEDSREIPTCVPYLLVGGGTASISAIRAIKEKDPKAYILVINEEIYYPYMRPPLSKELWFSEDKEAVEKLTFKQWNGEEKSLFFEPEEFYTQCIDLMNDPNGGVAVARGWKVTKIDAVGQKAFLEDGHCIEYGKCLVATGGIPKNLPIISNADKEIQDKVILYRNIPDFKYLDHLIGEATSLTIIGGGFLGSELAVALAKKGKETSLKVIQIFPEKGNMGKVLPLYLSDWTTNKVRKEGVEVIPESSLESVSIIDDQLQMVLNDGKRIKTDRLIVAVGLEPNTELGHASDLETDDDCGGFVVNAELMARSNLWIAGDCSCFYDVKFGRRRVEHHDHAVVSGRLAGENMAGGTSPYVHQSMFWSDLGPEVGYEAIGIVDSCLPTVGVFTKSTENDTPKAVVTETGDNIRSETEMAAEPVKPSDKTIQPPTEGEDYGKGIIFYLRNDIIVGMVLWNVFNRMNVARQVLEEDRKYDDINEVVKLFNLHGE